MKSTDACQCVHCEKYMMVVKSGDERWSDSDRNDTELENKQSLCIRMLCTRAQLLTGFLVYVLRNFQIARPSLHDFGIALRKLEIAKLHNAILKVYVYSNIKQTCTFP